MKKVLYSVLALAGLLTLSCAKEIDAPNAEFAQENLVPLTLTASYDVATKVTYEGLKTFGWEANDSIKVRVVSGDNKKYGWYALGAKAAGATAQFVGDVPDTYTPRDYAFYPGFKQNSTGGTSSAPSVRLPITYYLDEVDASSNPIAPHIDPSNCTKVYVSSANPLQFLPSVGSLQEGGSFKFQAAYGVLNIQMTDLDDAACGLRLVGTAGAYMGNYLMLDKTDLCYKIGAKYVSPSSGSTLSTTYIQYWFYPKADHTASIYLPVPVGTLPAGCYINIMDESGKVLYTQTFAKDVEVQRGKITTLAPFKAKYDWTLVGTGKFIDAYQWANFGFTDPVDVKIETSGNGVYRVQNPYGIAAEKYEYTIPSTAEGPDEYLSFSVVPVGSALHGVTTTVKGLVDFDDHYSGLVFTNYGVDPYIAHPGGWSSLQKESNYTNSIVAKYAADGETPAAVQLAPIYFWLTDPSSGNGYWTGNSGWSFNGVTGPSYLRNGLIQILFPGQTDLLDLTNNVAYVEITDPTPAQATAKVKVEMGKDIASIQMVIAANATDAAAAFVAGTDVVTATASGDFSVKLPANAPSGDYYVFGIVSVAEGLNSALNTSVISPAFAYSNQGEYESLGNAQFIDAYTWSIAGFPEGTAVSVEVKKSLVEDNKYLLVDPYGAAIKAFSYTPGGTVNGPDKELILSVTAEGYVDWVDDFLTGVFNPGFNSSKGTEMTITPPYWYAVNYPQYYADFGRGNNYIARYASDGKTPATIIMSPIYGGVEGGTWNPNYRESNPIQIVLPGSSPVDLNSLVSFKEMKDETPEQPIATVTLYLGESFESADIVIAANEEAAAAAYDAGLAYKATTSGDVDINMPANAPSGKYTVFAKLSVKEGINPLCGKTVTSDPFQYNNSSEDRGIKIEDVVGDYVASAVINTGSYSNYNLELSLAENTGDPTMGDVIITHFGDVAIGGAPDYEVYGWLDSKTGVLTIPVYQPMWNFGASFDGGLHNPESTDTDIVLLYGDDKSLRVENAEFLRVMLYEKGTTTIQKGYYYWYGNTTDYHLVFKPVVTSSSTAAAPKVNGQKTVSEKSFQVFSEKCHVASGKVANAPAAR